MIQSFPIVFAGYKMSACLRQGLSSSSLCLCSLRSGVSALSPSQTQSHITLSPSLTIHLYSPLYTHHNSRLLPSFNSFDWQLSSDAHKYESWRKDLVLLDLEIILSKPWGRDYRDSNARCQPGVMATSEEQVSNRFLQSSLAHFV